MGVEMVLRVFVPLALASCIALGSLSTAAAAVPPAAPLLAPAEWVRWADEMAVTWPARQTRTGEYVSGLRGGSRYGASVMGYGLLEVGLRLGNQRYVDSGLKGVTWAATRPVGYFRRESVFENLAVASAYNLARRRLGEDARFLGVKAAWAAFLRRRTPVSGFYDDPTTTRFGNHYLVECVAMLELFETGLRSGRPTSAIGGRRAVARARTRQMLLKIVPRLAAQRSVPALGTRTLVLSDVPDDPLSYHGLTTAMYARALELLGRASTKRAWDVAQRAARASWALTAPDGDMGYTGRSQEEGWGLAGTAFAAEAAARAAGSSAPWDRRFHTLADRTLGRLRDDYGVGANGLFIIPALREGRPGARGLDGRSVTGFSGLALMLTNWALDDMDRGGERSGGLLASDEPLRALLGVGESRFAVVRRGPVWMAVRKVRSRDRFNDLRYDFGLVAYKASGNGRWRDVLRLRPRVVTRATAGPILLNGGRGQPYGQRIAVARDGKVSITGGYRTTRGAVLRRGVRFTYRPAGACVEMTVSARRGDRIEQSLWLRSRSGPPRVADRTLEDRDQQLTSSLPFRAIITGSYTSAVDARLRRARLRFLAPRNRPLELRLCPAGG